MSTDVLKILDCNPSFAYQGPRKRAFGPNSGEEFRDDYLIPFIIDLPADCCGQIDFDGTVIYSPSFLEESFGGAVRAGYGTKIRSLEFINIAYEWKKELNKYIESAIHKLKGS